jgi:hypothetical protein
MIGTKMSIEKIQSVDLIEIIESGSVQVRTATRIVEDGVVISQSFHRHVIAPGTDYSGEDARVKAVCSATHTAEVIAAYKAVIAAQGV